MRQYAADGSAKAVNGRSGGQPRRGKTSGSRLRPTQRRGSVRPASACASALAREESLARARADVTSRREQGGVVGLQVCRCTCGSGRPSGIVPPPISPDSRQRCCEHEPRALIAPGRCRSAGWGPPRHVAGDVRHEAGARSRRSAVALQTSGTSHRLRHLGIRVQAQTSSARCRLRGRSAHQRRNPQVLRRRAGMH